MAHGGVLIARLVRGTASTATGGNGVPGTVRGLFYGDASQFVAQLHPARLPASCFVFSAFYTFFKIVEVTIGNRVRPTWSSRASTCRRWALSLSRLRADPGTGRHVFRYQPEWGRQLGGRSCSRCTRTVSTLIICSRRAEFDVAQKAGGESSYEQNSTRRLHVAVADASSYPGCAPSLRATSRRSPPPQPPTARRQRRRRASAPPPGTTGADADQPAPREEVGSRASSGFFAASKWEGSSISITTTTRPNSSGRRHLPELRCEAQSVRVQHGPGLALEGAPPPMNGRGLPSR